MSRPQTTGLAAYAGPAYLVAALLIAYSGLDYLGAVWPIIPSEVSWRYSSAGILTGFALTPLLGMLLAVLVATATGQRRALKAIATASLLLAAMFTLVLLGFGLDALQMRRDAPPEARRLFDQGIAKAGIKYLGAIVAWGWLGIRSWRVAGRQKLAGSADPSALVVR